MNAKSRKSGPLLVAAFLALAILGAFFTRWNYTKTNFATDAGTIRSSGPQATEGWAEAVFPDAQAALIRPGMMSIVSLKDYPGKKIEAFVETVASGSPGQALVSIRLPTAPPDVLYPQGAKCGVSVDASVSPEMLKAEKIPRR